MGDMVSDSTVTSYDLEMVHAISDALRNMNITLPLPTWMTGFPNPCARPYMAEIGLAGSGPKTYCQM